MRALVRAIAALGVLLFALAPRSSPARDDRARAPLVRFIVKHPWMTLGAIAVIGVAGVAVVVLIGVVPIKASSGHWRITTALLDFAKVRAVSTYSLAIRSPSFDLDDDALVVRGASHYETGCLPCHGGPGAAVPPVMAAMTPAPPALADLVSRFNDRELFFIVKHGIKFTGMPAWPVPKRDDEVWAVVAFLRKMPPMDVATYRQLAYGGSAPDADRDLSAAGQRVPQAVRDVCWRCHGVEGTGRGAGAFPSLAGQRAEYLHASLRAYQNGTRFSGIMTTVAANLNERMMREAVDYYAQLPPREREQAGDRAAIARGETIALHGVPDADIPACAECHGPTKVKKNPTYPGLARQHVRYLTLQLQLLQERRRGGSANVNLMHVFVDRLRPEQIRDVTIFYASSAAPPVLQ
jgi:cytochrome c553